MIRDARHVAPARDASYPVRMGNQVQPLIDGEAAFRRICEAVEAARSSVWVTVAYIDRDAAMPDGRGSFFDVLDAAGRRGLDVRALFWREPRLGELEPGATHFEGNTEERTWLTRRSAQFRARWDRHPLSMCHHQKSWLLDAGQEFETAFVGGINLDAASMARAGHPPITGEQIHDVYVEIHGPAATDVHHNFVQRWNESSERDALDGAWPDRDTAAELEFPTRPSSEAGDAPVQITRTVTPNCYGCEAATPEGKPFAISAGEHSVLEQYLTAIDSAERSLYFENQAIGSPGVVEALRSALERGVSVVFLVPGNAHPAFAAARKDPRAKPYFDKLAALGRYPRFTLAAISASRGNGHYQEIYVHSKILLVDDCWATIGSANVADRSFRHDTELNASVWHAPTVRGLRDALMSEHLGRSTADLDDREALDLFAGIARANRDRRLCWESLEGLAYAIEPSDYGL